jgi:3-oxoacyl-[acyl-carrier protein] reductase
MNLGLASKRASGTAANSGLGFATAQALSAEGAIVALCSRNVARAEEAAENIRQKTQSNVYAYQADVSVDANLKQLFERATQDLGSLDILVCNAGGPPSGSFNSLNETEWDKAYQLTLQSVVRSVRYAPPHFKKQGGRRILTIVSSSVKRPLPNLLLSNVFRPAVQGLCKAIAGELAPDNIQVNSLAPERIETERVNELDEALAKKQILSFEEVRKRSSPPFRCNTSVNLKNSGVWQRFYVLKLHFI